MLGLLTVAFPVAGWCGDEAAAAVDTVAAAATEEAAPTPLEAAKTELQNNINIVFTCVAAFLVFFMQAGFAAVEAGFTRAKNACNIIMKNVMDFSIGTIAWWVIGFAIMFGAGNSYFGGGSHIAASDYADGSSLNWTFWIFQCVFAGTAATIVSGAMAGRTKFTSYLAYSAVICGFIYPISGHWSWGGLFSAGEGFSAGWLWDAGFLDFAGSTVVHSCGGWLALAGAITLGPRIGKYGPNGESKAIPGHNIPLASLGVFILWFGWFGFNPGSQTAGVVEIGYIAMTTNLAAAAGAIGAMIMAWIKFGKPDTSMTLNGVLAGLVAITAGCNCVSPTGAVIIGFAAGILVVLAVEFIDKVLKIDDPVGAVSVHGVCGAFGTLALCFFQNAPAEDYSAMSQLMVQLQGAGTMFIWAFGCGMILFNLIKYTIGLRCSRDEEIRGLDIGEHGNEAYAGFQIFISQ
ncbi:MAG: ammonium transporter [Planctomycetes bacterium]|nr:ammonium transporter [Planctomycetota bacterium]